MRERESWIKERKVEISQQAKEKVQLGVSEGWAEVFTQTLLTIFCSIGSVATRGRMRGRERETERERERKRER